MNDPNHKSPSIPDPESDGANKFAYNPPIFRGVRSRADDRPEEELGYGGGSSAQGTTPYYDARATSYYDARGMYKSRITEQPFIITITGENFGEPGQNVSVWLAPRLIGREFGPSYRPTKGMTKEECDEAGEGYRWGAVQASEGAANDDHGGCARECTEARIERGEDTDTYVTCHAPKNDRVGGKDALVEIASVRVLDKKCMASDEGCPPGILFAPHRKIESTPGYEGDEGAGRSAFEAACGRGFYGRTAGEYVIDGALPPAAINDTKYSCVSGTQERAAHGYRAIAIALARQAR